MIKLFLNQTLLVQIFNQIYVLLLEIFKNLILNISLKLDIGIKIIKVYILDLMIYKVIIMFIVMYSI